MRQANGAGHLIMWAFFISIVGMNFLSSTLTSELKAAQNGQKTDVKIVDHELFARRDISGQGGIFEFVNNRVDEAQGLVNFDKGRLNQNEAFGFKYINIGYAKGATGKAGEVDYLSKLPTGLRNSEFEIKQNGRTVVTLPTASLSNPFTGQTEKDQWTELASIALLDDVNQFTWSFKFPDGVSIAAGETTNFHYLEVRLKGHRTIKKTA